MYEINNGHVNHDHCDEKYLELFIGELPIGQEFLKVLSKLAKSWDLVPDELKEEIIYNLITYWINTDEIINLIDERSVGVNK